MQLSIARLAALALLLAGCDSGGPTGGALSGPAPPATATVRAAGFDPGPVKSAAEYALEPELTGADVARGELLGLACAACHRFRAE